MSAWTGTTGWSGSYPNVWTESSLTAAYSGQKKDFRLGRLRDGCCSRDPLPRCIRKINWKAARSGTTWSGIRFRSTTSARVSSWPGSTRSKDLEPTGARFLTNVPMPDPLYRNTSRDYPGFNMNIPDQFRATSFISEMEEKYGKTGAELPQFLFIHLPNDHMADERPEDGYPYRGVVRGGQRLCARANSGISVEHASGGRTWPFSSRRTTRRAGCDHIDAQRTVLMCAGPWCKKNYVSHVNTSFPGLLKTIFRILRLPPLNLFDAAATDLDRHAGIAAGSGWL